MTNVSVSVDVLTNRHLISPYVYGVNFPPDAAHITSLHVHEDRRDQQEAGSVRLTLQAAVSPTV